MKITYTVDTNTDDGKFEAKLLHNAGNMYSALVDISNAIRQAKKYGDSSRDLTDEDGEKFSKLFWEAIEDNEVSIDL